ncbi:hypothetical protein NIES3585_46720 [Nodularia sp. NIES-3585]|nr:hypothetical protein NIES3585_46720 [Nodularia sp. NIES-3585]
MPTSDSYHDYLISRLKDPNYAAVYSDILALSFTKLSFLERISMTKLGAKLIKASSC